MFRFIVIIATILWTLTFQPMLYSQYGKDKYGANQGQSLFDYWFDRAYNFQLSNKPNQALIAYNKAIDINSSSATAYYNRGIIHYDLKHFESAIEDYNTAISLDPDNDDYYNNRANAYFSLGKNDEAINDYDRSIQLNPNKPSAYYNRANTYFTLMEYDSAIKDYDRTLLIDPNDVEAYHYRGLSYFYLREFELAIQNFDQAIQLDPRDADSLYYRGTAYFYLEDYINAEESYIKAIELSPDYIYAYTNLAELNIILDKPQKALLYLEKGFTYTLNNSDKAIFLCLRLIALTAVGEETVGVEKQYELILNQDFTLDWDFSFINRWKENSNLSQKQKDYIGYTIERIDLHKSKN